VLVACEHQPHAGPRVLEEREPRVRGHVSAPNGLPERATPDHNAARPADLREHNAPCIRPHDWSPRGKRGTANRTPGRAPPATPDAGD
jgi:hypothetical protein